VIALRAAGQGIEAVAQPLRHSTTAITYRAYARLLPGHLADAAEALNSDRPGDRARSAR